MLGDIPYDVFFDDPLSIIASSQPVASPSSITPTDDTGATARDARSASAVHEPAAGVTRAGDDADWQALIPADVLVAEITDIRNSLSQKVQSVGSFNQGLFGIPSRSSTMAVLAAVAMNHPGEIRWKKNAGYVRDLAAKMHVDKLQRGRKSLDQVQIPFEDIVRILNGSPPGDAEDPAPETDFFELADMARLMKRIEAAWKHMRSDAGNEDAFESESEMVRHEAAVLGTLMKIITAEGYGYADDEDFRGYARPVIESTQKILQAVQTGDFVTYDAALSTINQSCTACHSDFRNI